MKKGVVFKRSYLPSINVCQCDQFLRCLNIPIGSYVEGNPSGPCWCEPVPLSLAFTDYPFLVFPRQMNVQISWTMVVHELATVKPDTQFHRNYAVPQQHPAIATTTLSTHQSTSQSRAMVLVFSLS